MLNNRIYLSDIRFIVLNINNIILKIFSIIPKNACIILNDRV